MQTVMNTLNISGLLVMVGMILVGPEAHWWTLAFLVVVGAANVIAGKAGIEYK